MARTSNPTVLLNICAFFLLIGLGNCALQSTLCTIFNQPKELYVFRRLPPNPNATVAFVYPPGTNGTAPVGVPVIAVADNPVRRTPFQGSSIVGYERVIRSGGLRADDATRTQSNGVLDLQTIDLNGTISFAGIQAIDPDIPVVEEVAVTGGTGAFRAASGYIQIFLLSNSGGIALLKYVVFLCN